jgi:hypothetical protein
MNQATPKALYPRSYRPRSLSALGRLSMMALCAMLCTAATLPAMALPKMDITSAKGTLYKRQKTATGVEFNRRRVRDLPSFDKIGVGNYMAEYRLDKGQTLLVWMYVEKSPPEVDEVVLHVHPANPSDVTHKRALDLLRLVYGESLTGSRVINDFEMAKGNTVKNKYRLDTRKYQEQSLLPKQYTGGLYYLGNQYGYTVNYNKGGLEVGIFKKEALQALIMDVKNQKYPDPKPAPTAPPPPPPAPSPRPQLSW